MDKLDIKDRKIIHELDINSRQSASQIGRKVGLGKEVVNYRINNLIKNGIIKYFYTIINTISLDYYHYKIYFKLQNIYPEKEKEILEYFLKNKNCIWLGVCSGNYDLGVSLLAKDPNHFSELYQDILKKYGKYILEKNILVIDKAPTFNRAYLSDNSKPLEFEYSLKEGKYNLDDTDKKILSFLSTDARVSILDIIKKFNFTRDVVSYRIKRLIKQGVIQGFRTSFDLEKLGLNYYKVLLTFKNITPERENELVHYSKLNKNIIQYIKLIGNWDSEIEFEVSNDTQLHEILLELRNKFSDIIRNYEQLLIYEKKLDYFPF